MKYSMLFLFCMLSSTVVFSASTLSCDYAISKFGNKLSLPSAVSSFFYGESVNLEFPPSQWTEKINIYGTVGKNGLENLKCGTNPRVSYDLYLTFNAALELSTSKNPVQSFVKYMKTGDIRITANGFIPTLKLAIAKSTFGYYN